MSLVSHLVSEDDLLEIIKSLAFGVDKEEIANFAEIDVEAVEEIEKEYAKDIQERRRIVEEQEEE